MLRSLLNQNKYTLKTTGFRTYILSGEQGVNDAKLNPIVHSVESVLYERNNTCFLWCWLKFYESSFDGNDTIWTNAQKYIINAICIDVSSDPVYSKLMKLASSDELLRYDDFIITYKTKNKIRDTVHLIKYKDSLYTYALGINNRGECVFQPSAFDDIVCTGLLVRATVIEQKKLHNYKSYNIFSSNKILKYLF